MGYKYFEFGDGDVLARKKDEYDHDFELWRGADAGGWEPNDNTDRFYETANGPLSPKTIERIKGDFPGAFDGDASDKFHERLKAAISKSHS